MRVIYAKLTPRERDSNAAHEAESGVLPCRLQCLTLASAVVFSARSPTRTPTPALVCSPLLVENPLTPAPSSSAPSRSDATSRIPPPLSVRAGAVAVVRFAARVILDAAASILLLSAVAATLAAQATTAPGTGEPWRLVVMPQSSQVLARDGSLIGEVGRQWRSIVPIRSLPRYVPQAFVAVEDQRFYQHDGVDLVGVAGALKDALDRKSVV